MAIFNSYVCSPEGTSWISVNPQRQLGVFHWPRIRWSGTIYRNSRDLKTHVLPRFHPICWYQVLRIWRYTNVYHHWPYFWKTGSLNPFFLIFHGDLSVVNLELQQLRVLLGSSNDPKTDSWIERSLTIPDVDKPSLIFPKALPINRDKSWFKSIRFMINPFDSPPTKKWGGSPSAAARRPEIWWTPFLTAPPSSPVVPPSAGNVPWSSGRRWPTGDQRRMWWRWMRCLAPKTMSWWIGGMDLVVVHYHYLYIYIQYIDPMI